MSNQRNISDIRVGKRHRIDLGDVAGLGSSIRAVGLLHPIVIRPDGLLIAGERRLAACKALGMSRVPVTEVDLNEVVLGEFAENAVRKDFLPSEMVAIKRAVEPLIATPEGRPKGKPEPMPLLGKDETRETFPSFDAGRTRDKAAAYVGVSGRTLEKAEAIVKAAEAEPERFAKLADDMDRTGRVDGPFKRLKVMRQAEAIRLEKPSLPGRGPPAIDLTRGGVRKPLAIDLYCGLGGWTDGLLAEGYDVIGFDIEQHVYGEHRYPAQLVIQDVLTLHGAQFRDAGCIVASPPCQAYSWMAMPWSRAKAKAAAIRADATGKELERLNRLFMACFRIQREACEAAGRHIPMVVENVRGAQEWVGPARWSFGSFYLWADVPALMPITLKARKVAGFRFDGSGRSFQSASVNECGVKDKDADGYTRTHPAAFGWKSPRTTSSNVSARKAASAMIAKIPLPLSRWIARCFLPRAEEAA